MGDALQHFADRLQARIERVGAPLCVGLDPVVERLPDALTGEPLERIGAFCRGVIEAAAPVAAAVKFQSACFERHGPPAPGMVVLDELMVQAHQAGLIVILDAKRGDIGISSEHYAAATIGRPHVDAVTVSPYMGDDSLAPFVEMAASAGKGLFVLVRTSNPGSASVQELPLADGRTVAEATAALVASLGAGSIGQSGYSAVGAVVGATQGRAIARMRQFMPHQIFLLPGYGAQGGGLDDVRPAFVDGGGALVTASRSILYPRPRNGKSAGDGDWREAIAAAARRAHDELSDLC